MSRCALVLLVLPACGGAGPTAPGACDNGLPSAVVDVTLTGGVQQSGSFGIACATDTEDPWQTSLQHLPPELATQPLLSIAITHAQDWGLTLAFDMPAVEAGEFDVLTDGFNFGTALGHGWVAEPVGPDGYLWTASSGSITVDSMEDWSAGGLAFHGITGSVDVSLAHVDGGGGTDVSIDFQDLLFIAQ